MSRSYIDTPTAVYDEKRIDHSFKSLTWKYFRGDVIAL